MRLIAVVWIATCSLLLAQSNPPRHPFALSGSLLFGGATSDVADCGDGTSLQGSNLKTRTVLLWMNHTANTAGNPYYAKTTANRFRDKNGGFGDLEVNAQQSTTNAQYVTNTAKIVTNKWFFIGFTFTDSGSSRVHIYIGDLNNPAAEQTYSTSTDGSGTASTDSGTTLHIANGPVNGGAVPANIPYFAMWNRVLSAGEIRDVQIATRTGLFCSAGTVLCVSLAGTGGKQWDYSGMGNHCAVTGARPSFGLPMIRRY